MKIGRNDPCHCGSGTKYKKCCLATDEAARAAALAAQATAQPAAADPPAPQANGFKPSRPARNAAPPKGLPSKSQNLKRKRAV